MVFVSPRSLCESYRRHRQRVKDPEDRSVPGNVLRIKTDVGYVRHRFRYDLPIPKHFFDVLHPDDIKKVKKRQIPEDRTATTNKKEKKTKAKRRTK